MTWVKLDDGFPDHPKVVNLSIPARWAFVAGLCYCASYLTDGLIPERKAREFGGVKAAGELIAVGLWERNPDGIRVHDYLEYNQSKATVKEKLRVDSERKRAGNASEARRNPTVRSRIDPIPVDPGPTGPPDQEMTPPPQPSLTNGAQGVVPVVRLFERCFGRLLSPMEIENIKHLEDEQPRERIEYALREASDLGKRSVRYVQVICENQAEQGDNHERPGRDNGGQRRGTNGAAAAADASAAIALAVYGPGGRPVYVLDAGGDGAVEGGTDTAPSESRLET